MGRHSRPTPAQLARANSLKAVTVLGVAGTIAFGLHSSVGGDKSTQARSDVHASQEQKPDIDPTADDKPSGSHISPSESAKPRPLPDQSDHTDGSGGGGTEPSGAATPSHTPTATPSTPAHTDVATSPTQRGDQAPAAPSSPARTLSDDPSTPGTPSGQPSESPQPGNGGGQGKGVVGDVVDGVGNTLDGVVGGLSGALGG
ncbi:extensin (Cell wall hydroxyproline-rich glycoprotein) [Streptomyces himastatinicus ATCC 53653]|uniref:Extensin (Cell wall hydroxyproline-rich glycoprotein) n=1 Tax=Streptomyces himastatinicus ATCC 53653 TaxID=457427 RepID=D9W7I4_9ACTN|nr:extensin (Cell wall hydroxyproline-rich glycoprotein) [Streptomyces himastatinicus ATCC 53653]